MEWKPEIKDSEFVPQKRKPTEETVCYKIGGTYYEVSTSCGGSERLRDKMIWLIKSETVVLNHLKIWLFRCMIFQRNTVTYGIYGGIKIMITESKYPILEFDDNKVAKLNPTSFVAQSFETDKLIITFFPEVMDKLIKEGKIIHEKTIGGENPVLIYRFLDDGILITLGQVGCPACAGNLDLFNAMGITKVMFCGGGGVLDKNIKVGQILVVDGAIRDEGFSYHYIEPSKYIFTDPETTEIITTYLENNSISYIRGLTWTTDAIFRETADKIARRKGEGAKIVEMEQAGCIAVSQFRGFKYGALIYGGDDVSQDEWSNRGWRSREGIRYDLVTLCKKLVGIL